MTTGVGLWLLDTDGRVFRFLGALQDCSDEIAEPDEQWKLVHGRLKRLSATRDCAWGLDSEDRPVVYVHSTYVPIRVEVDVYETETRSLLGRTNSGSVLWTNSDGSESSPHPHSFQLPSINWEWERAWGVDTDHQRTDSEGWYNPSKGVRRRRWIRHRAYTASDRFALVPGIDADNPKYDPFRDVAVGGTELPGREDGSLCVWAVTLRDAVVFREGITRSTPEGVSWLKVPTAQKTINQLSVGPTGVVWATTYDGSALVRVGACRERPSGIRWVHVPAPGVYCLTHLAVGLNVVWATSTGNKVWFRKGIKISAGDESGKSSVEGTEWVEMVGESEFLSVGPDDQVYMIGAGRWPVQFRSGVRREELGGALWVPLHGALGREAYVEERERQQQRNSGQSVLEMDNAGVAMIRTEIMRSKQSFRRKSKTETSRPSRPTSSASAPSSSLSIGSVSLGSASPTLTSLEEERSRFLQPEDTSTVVRRRSRLDVDPRPRTSSMPSIFSVDNDNDNSAAVVAADPSSTPLATSSLGPVEVSYRTRSFGFSPGMISKSQALRRSTHETALPELAQGKGRRHCAVYDDGNPGATPLEKLHNALAHDDRHHLTAERPATGSESCDGGGTASPDGDPTAVAADDDTAAPPALLGSPDISDFVKVSFAEQSAYGARRAPSPLQPTTSIPCRKHSVQASAATTATAATTTSSSSAMTTDETGERRLSRGSPLAVQSTASSSCTTTDSGISVNLATAMDGELGSSADVQHGSEGKIELPQDRAANVTDDAAPSTDAEQESDAAECRDDTVQESEADAAAAVIDSAAAVIADSSAAAVIADSAAAAVIADSVHSAVGGDPASSAGITQRSSVAADVTPDAPSSINAEEERPADRSSVTADCATSIVSAQAASSAASDAAAEANSCTASVTSTEADSTACSVVSAEPDRSTTAASAAVTTASGDSTHSANLPPDTGDSTSAGADETDSPALAPATISNNAWKHLEEAEEENIIISKSRYDPAIAIGLEERIERVARSGSRHDDDVFLSRPHSLATESPVLNVHPPDSDAAPTVAPPAPAELQGDATAAFFNEHLAVQAAADSSEENSTPLFPEAGRSTPLFLDETSLKTATSSEAAEDDSSGSGVVQVVPPPHPVTSVHSWKWISAGGCVPPHDDVTKPGAFLGSGLTAAVTLSRRAKTTQRRDSVLRKTGWRQSVLRQLRERNEREVAAFRDSMDCGDSGVWSKKGHLTWCLVNASSHPPYHFTSVSVVLNRGSRLGGQLEFQNQTSQALERINLSEVSCVMPVASDDVGQPYCFLIHTPQNVAKARYMLLCCADERDRDDWYTAISMAALRSQALDGPPAPNSMWALTLSGEVYISDPSKNPGLPHERRWRGIGGHLRSISAGACGVVWGISFDGTPLAYNGGFGGGVFVQSVDATSSNLQEHTDSRWTLLIETQQTKGVSWGSSVWEDEMGRTHDKKTGLLPSKAWKWTTEWLIDYDNSDQDGWQRQGKAKSSMSLKGPRKRVRKWKRRMTIVTPGPWMEILPCPNCLASVSVQTWPQQPLGAHDNVAVWAMDVHGDVICRYGVTASQPQGEEWRWVSSNTRFTCIGVGSNRDVWGISDSGCAYIRLGITDIKQSGTSWKRISMPASDRFLTEVAVGSKRVWVRDNKGDLWFRNGISAKLPEGQDWTKVPGTGEKLSLSANNQLWIVQNGAICRLRGVTPEQPMGSRAWDLALKPCWYSVSAGATDVSHQMTRAKTVGSRHDCNMIGLKFEDLKAGFPLLVKGNNMFWCAAVFLQLDRDTDKIQVQMIHEGRHVRWCTRQNVTLDIPPPEACLSLSMKVLYKYNYVGDSYYKLGDLENVNHLDNSYKILSAVRNVARTKEDLRLPPEALADAQRKTNLDSVDKQLVSEAALRAAGKYKKLGGNSVRRRQAANISEEGHTGTVAIFTKLSGRETEVASTPLHRNNSEPD